MKNDNNKRLVVQSVRLKQSKTLQIFWTPFKHRGFMRHDILLSCIFRMMTLLSIWGSCFCNENHNEAPYATLQTWKLRLRQRNDNRVCSSKDNATELAQTYSDNNAPSNWVNTSRTASLCLSNGHPEGGHRENTSNQFNKPASSTSGLEQQTARRLVSRSICMEIRQSEQ